MVLSQGGFAINTAIWGMWVGVHTHVQMLEKQMRQGMIPLKIPTNIHVYSMSRASTNKFFKSWVSMR